MEFVEIDKKIMLTTQLWHINSLCSMKLLVEKFRQIDLDLIKVPKLLKSMNKNMRFKNFGDQDNLISKTVLYP